MADVIDPDWGDPGAPGSDHERHWKAANLTWITLNCGVQLLVNKLVAPLFKGFWDELEEETGYSLADRGAPDDWGFANRPNRNNPKAPSRHSRGLATDGNAEENPNTHDGKLHTNLPVDVVRRLAKKYSLRWGGDYKGPTKDTMHMEFVGSPHDARVAVAALTHPALTHPALTPAAPRLEEDDMFILNPVTDDPDRTQFFVNGSKRVALTADEAQQFRNSGFPTKDMEPLAFAIFKTTNTEEPRP